MQIRAIIVYFTMLVVVINSSSVAAVDARLYDWAIVGAGPGGIITVGVLLDAGISPEKILWVDPEFAVGRMGKYYASVPANNKAKRLVEFLGMCSSFKQVQTPAVERLKALNPDKEYPLKYIIDPLQDITDCFLERVHSAKDSLTALDFHDDAWHIAAGERYYVARRVVLATGSHPREFNFGLCPTIPLDIALNTSELAKVVTPQDTVAVVGSAHSAVLVLKFLCDVGAARIVNFYKHPLYYLTAEEEALRHKECTLYGDPLQGIAGQWAREVLDPNPPGNLLRVKVSDAAIKAWMPICTKVIYAAGFEKNPLPPISGVTYSYDNKTGIIGPHIFGIGMAFPEFVDDGKGHCLFAIGLRDFMRFAQKMVPEWMHKDIPCKYERYEDFIGFFQL
jgi:hypothetical protein